MKDLHIDWMNEQDEKAAFIRAAKEADFASKVNRNRPERFA